tara:strand:- start:356 stop:565 length:210 start_codon:yes stop_codon:yes gene_type:complete
MRFDHFDSNQDESLMSIQDLKESRIRKQKIENDKKARKYIFEINQRYRKMNAHKNNKFLKNINPFKKAA